MSEDKISELVDRKAFADDISFAAKSCMQIVDLVKQAKKSIVDISQASNFQEFISASQKANSIVDAATSSHQELIDALNKEKAALQEASATLKQVAGSLDANIKAQLQYKAELKAVQTELKEMQKAAAANNTTLDDSSKKMIDLAKREAELKQAISETNQSIKSQVKENAAAEGSYDEMNAKLGQLRNTFRQLSEEERNGDVGKSLLGGINELDAKLKTIDASMGNFQRNVGNYSGSLKPAFDSLKNELQSVYTQLSGMKNTDPGFSKLEADAKLLESVIQSVDKSFTSTRQEMKAFTEASKVLGQQFGTTNELFQNFVQEVGSQKDDLDDIQNTINFNSSDTKYLDGIVAGINGIVGAYGAWQAATVLLGDDNEELQKSMQKLQAILTLVQSLQAVLNAVQTESGAVQTALAAKTALVTAAKKVEALVFGQSTTALATNTVATEANATAQTTLAAGEAAATAGAISFRTALISTGIGALIVLIALAIGKLVSVISDWMQADQKAIESQKDLAEALNEVAQAQIDLAKEVRKSTDERIKAMEDEIAVMQARGVTTMQQLALEKKISEEKLSTIAGEMIQNDVTKASRDALHENFMAAKQDEISILNEIAKLNSDAAKNGKKVDEDDLKTLKTKLERQQAITNGIKIQFDYQNELVTNQQTLEQNLAINKAKEDKANADDKRKLVLETTKLETDWNISKNNIILSSDKSTIQQKINALKSNLEEQKKVSLAERNFILNDITASNTDKEIARKKYIESLRKLNVAEKEQEKKLMEDYAKKISETEFNIKQNTISSLKSKNDEIVNNELETVDRRLNALSASITGEKQLIDNEYNYQKSIIEKSIPDKELRDKKLQLLEADNNDKLVKIVADGEKKKLEVIRSAAEQKEFINQKFREFILQTTQADVERTQDYSKDIAALNYSLQTKKISYQKYQEEVQVLENKYAEESIRIELEKQKKLVEIGKLSVADKKQALKKIADLEKQLSDAGVKTHKDNEDIKRNHLLKTLDYAKQITDEILNTVKTVLTANLEAQKNALQDQIDSIDKKKEAEIAAVNASTLSAQEKADKIAVIDATAQAKKEELERRQRELDNRKARIERTFQIFQILGNTAMAVTKFLSTGDIPGSIVAGIIGAAQLAAVLATPIPKYAKGTDNHIGGAAWVGDGGKKELAILPDGKQFVTPDKPTLMNLPKHTKILPDADEALRSVADTAMMMTLISAGAELSEKDFDKAFMSVLTQKLDKLESIEKALANLPINVWNIDDSGVTRTQLKGGNYYKFVNNHFKH